MIWPYKLLQSQCPVQLKEKVCAYYNLNSGIVLEKVINYTTMLWDTIRYIYI